MGSLSREILCPGGLSLEKAPCPGAVQEIAVQGGVAVRGGFSVWRGSPSRGQTYTCENITFPCGLEKSVLFFAQMLRLVLK